MISLSPRNVHLWWSEPSADAASDLRVLLSAEEIDTANRFRFERHRTLYVFAHGMLRTTLASYTDEEPGALVFERGGKGRPELRGRAVRFNLSHTEGLVLIGVTRDGDLGVDAECIDAGRESDEQLAARVFTPGEMANWRADRAFFERWALKEAYIKARGDGLSLDLQRFGFPSLGERPRMESDFGDVDEWQFFSFAPTPEHRAAAAVRVRDGSPVTWRTFPLKFGES